MMEKNSHGVASTIIQVQDEEICILRQGKISKEEILNRI